MVESAIVGALAINTGINVIQSTNVISRIQNWTRLFGSRLVSLSKEQNPGLFFQITKYLHEHSSKLQHRTCISYGNDDKTCFFMVPAINTEIEIEEEYGDIWVKTISLDGYNIYAYEITCRYQQPKVVDRFIFNLLTKVSPHVSEDDLKILKKLFKLDDNILECHYPNCRCKKWSVRDYEKYCKIHNVDLNIARKPAKNRYLFYLHGPHSEWYKEWNRQWKRMTWYQKIYYYCNINELFELD